MAKPQVANWHVALGLVTARTSGPVTPKVVEAAAGYFRRAGEQEPTHVIASLNLVECLVALRQAPAAITEARRTLALLDASPQLTADRLDCGHFPIAYDLFRVEWERAAWANAGRPAAEAQMKAALLRWRLHTLLADLTGELVHHYEAALARPDLPVSQATLGCALARGGRVAEAVEHLRQAVAANPFAAMPLAPSFKRWAMRAILPHSAAWPASGGSWRRPLPS